MSLPEGLERLLRAAYEAGANDAVGGGSPLDKALVRIQKFDIPQPGVYGRASKDFLTHVRNALGRCPECGHAPHGNWCANMASDNDCSCTYDPAGEFIGTIEVGDRLTALAGLADVTEPERPSLMQIGTPVHFKEGTFVVMSVSHSGRTTVELQDQQSAMSDQTVKPPTYSWEHGQVER